MAETLRLHAREAGSPKEGTRLPLALVTSALVKQPASTAAWYRVVAALVQEDRHDDALTFLRMATDSGYVDGDAWLELAFSLYAHDEVAEAWMVIEQALARLPPTAEIWSVAAVLRYEFGLPEQAAEAVARADAMQLFSPGASLTGALLCARTGDVRGARARIDEARRAGVPSAILAGYERRCGLA